MTFKDNQDVIGRKRAVLYWCILLGLLVLVPSLLGELVLRIMQGQLLSLHKKRSMELRSGLTVYDPELGYRLMPGYTGPMPGRRLDGSAFSIPVSIGENGCRTNGTTADLSADNRTILAVGDSFTFGYGVRDNETWPANLERILQQRVINAGTSGYGMDQIVLYTERMLQHADPDLLILAVIPRNVYRAQCAYAFHWKPYFVISDQSVVLKNVPVPDPAREKYSGLLDLLSYSCLADRILSVFAPRVYLTGTLREVPVHDRGADVAVYLIERIHRLVSARDIKLIYVVLGNPIDTAYDLVLPSLQRAEALGIEVVDLYQVVIETIEQQPAMYSAWFLWNDSHMSAAGNRWVAEQIAAAISRARYKSAAVQRH